MLYRMLDDNGDMMPLTAMATHFEGARAVGAAIRSRILSFKGEWWEYPDEGIPIESLYGRLNPEKEKVLYALIRDRIAQTDGVLEVVDLTIETDHKTRNRTVTCTVNTEYGRTVVEV